MQLSSGIATVSLRYQWTLEMLPVTVPLFHEQRVILLLFNMSVNKRDYFHAQ